MLTPHFLSQECSQIQCIPSLQTLAVFFLFLFTFHLYHCGGSRLHVGFPRASPIRFSAAPLDRVTHPGGRLNNVQGCHQGLLPRHNASPPESQGHSLGNAGTREAGTLPLPLPGSYLQLTATPLRSGQQPPVQPHSLIDPFSL